MVDYTHWLKAEAIPGSTWQKVSKEDWIKAERRAGFRPQAHDVGQYATGGFGGDSIRGALTVTDTPPND